MLFWEGWLSVLASVLQAASPPKAREPWKPRPGDGISSNWLIAELTHRQAHELKLQRLLASVLRPLAAMSLSPPGAPPTSPSTVTSTDVSLSLSLMSARGPAIVNGEGSNPRKLTKYHVREIGRPPASATVARAEAATAVTS